MRPEGGTKVVRTPRAAVIILTQEKTRDGHARLIGILPEQVVSCLHSLVRSCENQLSLLEGSLEIFIH